MRQTFGQYEITDERERVDFATVHAWLTSSYWSPGISQAKVEQAARYSALVVSAFAHPPGPGAAELQVGYCRVVSDRTRFAWLADVFIDAEHRGRGLGHAIVRFALDHPDVADVGHWLLGTKDAHGVYETMGFGPPAHPDRLMQLRRRVEG